MGEAFAIFGMAIILPFYMITTIQCFMTQEKFKKLGRSLRSVLSLLVSPLTFYLVWKYAQKFVMILLTRLFSLDGNVSDIDSLSSIINFLSGFASFAVFLVVFGLLYKIVIKENLQNANFVYFSFVMILMSCKSLMLYNINLSVTIMTCVILPTLLYSLYYTIIDIKMRTMLKVTEVSSFSSINLIPVVAIAIIYIYTYFLSVAAGVNEESGNNAISGLSFMIGILLLMLVFICYNMIFENMRKAVQVMELTKDVQSAQENVIISFAEITETKSGQTGGHIHRVAEYSKVLAKALKLSDEDAEALRIAAMMHDIGKLMIPPDILEKEERLTDEEYEIMKKHVVYGEGILHNAPGKIMEYAKTVALEHHERWDGNGYLGIANNNIHRISRIVSVADVFDALVSNRSYKVGWSLEKAKAMIVKESGSQFDPAVVEAFVKHFDEITEVYDAFPDNVGTDDVNHSAIEKRA